ncbi:hypothetical protein JZ751_010830 [Albula glossodonta]|uniref:NADH dehydrogenase [ubiquinone] 1 alpha subcomplex assembly factor 3 n=1 Tax=Albula glossodonta TaxID=121402 RepID=A0A8T2N0E2_9TELE|nr:hypothetical protein JZ751_010830 [Albula glossodonta]
MATASCARLFLRGAVNGLRLAPVRPVQTRAHRLGPTDDEMYQRTRVSILQKDDPSGVLIYSYSSHGFNINGSTVVGPCALLPPTVLQWNVSEAVCDKSAMICFPLQVGSYKDITVESMALFHMVEPRIEILVLGTGARVERIDPKVLEFMRKKGIAVEVQATANACATFNFLASERRITAAGLIPPPPNPSLT